MNNELIESYRNIQNEIEILKQENKIRCIETKNPIKKTMIFGKDPKYDNMNLKVPQSF